MARRKVEISLTNWHGGGAWEASWTRLVAGVTEERVGLISVTRGAVSLASASFKRDGFCVAWPGTWHSSHLLAFYVDAVCAVALAALYRRFRVAEGAEPLKGAATGVLAHGVAHAAIARNLIGGGASSAPPTAMVAVTAGLSVFFFCLFKSVPGMPEAHSAAHAVFHGLVHTLLVPPRLGFTYVQTVVLWVTALYALRRRRDTKDVYYDLTALIITLPVGFVSWLEALTCDRFFKAAGGHVYYDAIIPVSYFLYCAVAIRSPVNKPTTKVD